MVTVKELMMLRSSIRHPHIRLYNIHNNPIEITPTNMKRIVREFYIVNECLAIKTIKPRLKGSEIK